MDLSIGVEKADVSAVCVVKVTSDPEALKVELMFTAVACEVSKVDTNVAFVFPVSTSTVLFTVFGVEKLLAVDCVRASVPCGIVVVKPSSV